MPGIVSASVNLLAESAHVIFNNTQIDEGAVIEKMNNAGL